MITDLSSSILFKCPVCGEKVEGHVNIFNFSNGEYNLFCKCGGSSLRALLLCDGRIKVTAPCAVCEGEHTSYLPKSVFFTKELFFLSCPPSDLDVCVLGAKAKARREYDRIDYNICELIYEEELDFMLEEDPLKIKMLERLGIMADEGHILCGCKSGELEFRLTDDSIDIRCKHCAAFLSIPANENSDYKNLMMTKEYVLAKKKKNRVVRD